MSYLDRLRQAVQGTEMNGDPTRQALRLVGLITAGVKRASEDARKLEPKHWQAPALEDVAEATYPWLSAAEDAEAEFHSVFETIEAAHRSVDHARIELANIDRMGLSDIVAAGYAWPVLGLPDLFMVLFNGQYKQVRMEDVEWVVREGMAAEELTSLRDTLSRDADTIKRQAEAVPIPFLRPYEGGDVPDGGGSGGLGRRVPPGDSSGRVVGPVIVPEEPVEIPVVELPPAPMQPAAAPILDTGGPRMELNFRGYVPDPAYVRPRSDGSITAGSGVSGPGVGGGVAGTAGLVGGAAGVGVGGATTLGGRGLPGGVGGVSWGGEAAGGAQGVAGRAGSGVGGSAGSQGSAGGAGARSGSGAGGSGQGNSVVTNMGRGTAGGYQESEPGGTDHIDPAPWFTGPQDGEPLLQDPAVHGAGSREQEAIEEAIRRARGDFDIDPDEKYRL